MKILQKSYRITILSVVLAGFFFLVANSSFGQCSNNKRILVYQPNSSDYNRFYPDMQAMYTNDGYNVTITNTFPGSITSAETDPTNGYSMFFMMGSFGYSSAQASTIRTYLSNNGKVFFNWEVQCCETASASTVQYLNSLVTGLNASQVPNTAIAYNSTPNAGAAYNAVNVGGCGVTLEGGAYRYLNGIPTANQLLATSNLNGSSPAINSSNNVFGMKFSGNELNGTGGKGVIAGFGDVNIWYRGFEPGQASYLSPNVKNWIESCLFSTAPTISSQPASQTVACGSTPNPLTVTATATSSINYQWYVNTTNSNTGGTAISSATASSYSPPVSVASGNRYYYVVVSSGTGCSTTSSVATVTTGACCDANAGVITRQ